MKTFIDKKLLINEKIAFNAGMRTRSIIMKSSDLPLKDSQLEDLCE
jgi:prolyl-tRNA editing enzyme YbaK/EbsC (Cys-tRNA(Pro) deacylase)